MIIFYQNSVGLIPFHEKSDTDPNPENFAASRFFNCELRIVNWYKTPASQAASMCL